MSQRQFRDEQSQGAGSRYRRDSEEYQEQEIGERMAPLGDIQVSAARDLVRSLIDRTAMREGWSDAWLVLSIEQARLLWWAMKWLEVIGEGAIQQTDFPLDYCRRSIAEKIEVMKQQDGDDKVLQLSRRDVLMLIDAEQHLDSYAMLREFDQKSKKYRNGAKKR